jgi:hypothetical protein
MKKMLALLLWVLLLFFFMQVEAIQPGKLEQEVDGKIDLAIKHLKQHTDKSNHFEKGFHLLLDAMSLSVPESRLSQEFKSKVTEATGDFKKNGVYIDGKVNQKGLRILWDAFHMVKEDTLIDGSGPAPTAEDFEAKIKRARKYLHEGSTHRVTETLLEGVLILFPPPPME